MHGEFQNERLQLYKWEAKAVEKCQYYKYSVYF